MYKISIPNPCGEKWEEMTPQGNGAFCGQCSKIVVDFTQMSDDEVKNYLLAHAQAKVCGKFRTDQVDNVRVEIPDYIIYKEPSFFKKFMLISLVIFGTTLYSCTSPNGAVNTGTEFTLTSKDTIPPSETIGKIAAPPADTSRKSCKPDSAKINNIMGGVALINEDSTSKSSDVMGEVVRQPVPQKKKSSEK